MTNDSNEISTNKPIVTIPSNSELFDLDARVINESAHVKVTWKLQSKFSRDILLANACRTEVVMFIWAYRIDDFREIRSVVPIEHGECIIQFNFSGDCNILVVPVSKENVNYILGASIVNGRKEYRSRLISNSSYFYSKETLDSQVQMFSELPRILSDKSELSYSDKVAYAIRRVKINDNCFAKEPPAWLKRLANSGVPDWLLTTNSCDFNKLLLTIPFYQLPLVLFNLGVRLILRYILTPVTYLGLLLCGVIPDIGAVSRKHNTLINWNLDFPIGGRFYASKLVDKLSKGNGSTFVNLTFCLIPSVIVFFFIFPVLLLAAHQLGWNLFDSDFAIILLLILPVLYLTLLLKVFYNLLADKHPPLNLIKSPVRSITRWFSRRRKVKEQLILERIERSIASNAAIDKVQPKIQLSNWAKFRIWFAELKAGICLPYQT